MPRNLARLRFRAPRSLPKPLDLSRPEALLAKPDVLAQQLSKHVRQISKPLTPLAVRTVLDPGWKRQPAKKTKTKALPLKPLSLRDLVDPDRKAKHGTIIYVFRNDKSNQVIYSLSEMMENYHLEQLPFMGKHSKPPVLRPDEWLPYFVVKFPTPEQGHQAFRKLREYRKLHETTWDKTHPQWLKLSKEKRMKKIMDQAANSVADLAAILKHQEKQAKLMRKTLDEHHARTTALLQKRWHEINELAAMSTAKDRRDGDSVKWLNTQISNLTWQQGLKHNQDDVNQRRLETAKRSHEIRLRKIEFAQRKSQQFKEWEEKLSKQATLANEPGAEERLAELKEDHAILKEDLANPDPENPPTPEEIEADRAKMKETHTQIQRLEAAFTAKDQLDNQTHYIFRTILPRQLKKEPPQPFSMDGVTVSWADLRDLEYVGAWPRKVVMDILPIKNIRQDVAFLTQNEYNAVVEDEVSTLLRQQGIDYDHGEARNEVPAAAKKMSVLDSVSKLNPFAKRVEAA
ncbi:hypothetical protein DM02DRAFT_606007 [Periconia macrospinosa]|uniref:Large ribosomal subunit protein mL67 n=1 Tax=Periconia macrospinosa TaxID=97972 RepID=A0A2V1D1S0_9PLEO|nr:hypothetical protein DM02DRAFT_606007 [Periconia macrospinosa]